MLGAEGEGPWIMVQAPKPEAPSAEKRPTGDARNGTPSSTDHNANSIDEHHSCGEVPCRLPHLIADAPVPA
jgi:hypothetical protein